MSNTSALTMTSCLPDTQSQTVVSLKNVLHYIPQNFHDELIPEFLEKLKTRVGFYCA
ncbi:hypothetical protein [Desulfobacter curvatus]|uniref:hypothetical protein n=1 Tax=Desulfobacter curvatus TaxID=2290 RepID=UPI00036CDB3C|nr:hypothetical protein [Desulfobacter curvatus]